MKNEFPLDTDQKSIVSFFSKDLLSEETIYELNIITEIENKLNGDDLIYETGNKREDKITDFKTFKTIISFGTEVYKNNLSIHDALEQKIRLKGDVNILKNLRNIISKSKKKKNKEKVLIFKTQLY